SISKSVTALAVGIAQDEGLLSLEDRLVDHLPAPSGGYGEGIEQVRLRHLRTMTSGSPITVFLEEQREHEDVTGLVRGTRLLTSPGEGLECSNGSSFLLARVIAERAGQNLRDWLTPRPCEPLGIVNPQWHTSRDGHTWG